MTLSIRASTQDERRELYREFKPRFDEYLSYLTEWNRALNLYSRGGEVDPLNDLLLPSLACADSDMIQNAGQGIDLGSGGGFPGLVLAIARPDLTIRLTERIRKKTSFLRFVIQKLQLSNVSVFFGDVALISDNIKYNFMSARLFSSIGNITGYAQPLLAENGVLLVFKPDSEMEDFKQLGWRIRKRLEVGVQRSLFLLEQG
ncbi:16S rRNA (guanine(527)-N(7))-methyltransferase RsmG [bacterium]|nr:16S rRNA (guanine(527)-N(7))-methyltransferase RsmG [bacterium]